MITNENKEFFKLQAQIACGWVSEEAAAAMLGINPKTLGRSRVEYKLNYGIRYQQPGLKRYIYNLNDIKNYLEKNGK